ncbi:MAG: glycerate kinase [Anaerolineae bacterium]|nr:glycerate kinase [Anaerolineae bacterium]MDW8173645.1 glycerate kinase [Anaerolineae bacterium]
MKIIIAPNAFKGALSAPLAAQAIADGLRHAGYADLHLLPIADGGDGTLDAFLHALGGQRRSLTVRDALGRPCQAEYAILSDGTALIEMAQASGLRQLMPADYDTWRASTIGTGELLRAALEAGARRFIVGLGGSATTDGGAGALQALGVRFLNAQNRPEWVQGGGALRRIANVDLSGLDPRWRDCEIILASDVDNPAVGPQGAAYIFARQKGADDAQIAQLDAHLDHYFGLLARATGRDVRAMHGAGAAGALAGGLLTILGGRIEAGVELLLDAAHFDSFLAGAGLLISGEGQIDGQSLRGKAPFGAARRAKAAGVPCVALVGSVGADLDEAELAALGIDVVLPIGPRPMPLSEALALTADSLRQTAYRLGRLLALTR